VESKLIIHWRRRVMIHKSCGGKLTVIESIQKPNGKGVTIRRIRVCKKCGVTMVSNEIVTGAEIVETYKHRNYYREGKE
jgi:transcriptional regulator NrdR family protein